jgi:hypothetical protein
VSTGRALCPGCSGPVGPGNAYCPACGRALSLPPASPDRPADAPAQVPSRGYRRLRLVLLIWLIAYPIISCSPVILGAATGGVSLGLAGLLVAATFFVPWLVGIAILGALLLLAR